MELTKEVMSPLREVVEYLTQRISCDEFDCLEALHEWFKKVNIKDWEDFVKFKDVTYNRISLESNELYDLLLICWQPNQGSAYHPHPKHGCLVKVLEGRLTEEFRKEEGAAIQVNEYKEGDTVYICNDIGIHRVQNMSTQPTISLHLYAPGDYTP